MVSDNLLTQKKKISKCRVVRRPLFLVTREGVQEDRGAHGAERVPPFEDPYRVAFGAQRVAQGQARRPRAYHSNVRSRHQ